MISRASSVAWRETSSSSAIAPAIAARRRSASVAESLTGRDAAALLLSARTNTRLNARPGDAGLPMRRSSPTAVPFIEIAADQRDQRRHGLRRIVAARAEMQGRALGGL